MHLQALQSEIAVTPEESKRELYEILDKLVRNKIDTNRRYIDEILEKLQDQNRAYFLDKMKFEIDNMQAAINSGDIQKADRHRILAETYKSIVERCFGQTE